jgi:hypothetical protein
MRRRVQGLFRWKHLASLELYDARPHLLIVSAHVELKLRQEPCRTAQNGIQTLEFERDSRQ